MNLILKQEMVDNWVSGYKVKYFSPFEILANMREEYDEFLEVLKELPLVSSEIEKELLDILFATICMANSHDIDLSKYVIVKALNLNELEYLQKSMSNVTRATIMKYGHKKPKPNELVYNLESELFNLIKSLEIIAKSHSINIDSAWQIRFKERTKRDDARFEKNN